MTGIDLIAVLVAVGFALAMGINDGGPLVAVGGQPRILRPVTALSIVIVALVVAPLVLGLRVVDTLASGLVDFGLGGAGAAMGGLVAAMAVSTALSMRGLPTSLAVAMVGALLGAGWASGLQVSWAVATGVVATALVCPVIAAAVTAVVHRAGPYARPVRVPALHRSGFLALSIAYAANSGQKMLAAFVLAQGSTGRLALEGYGYALPRVAILAVAFGIGAMASVRRVTRTLGHGVRANRPYDVAVTEWGAALTVMGTAAIGVPVSMTQSLAGAAVGSGLPMGAHRVRWQHVGRLGAAWLLTLPTAFVAGALCGLLVNMTT